MRNRRLAAISILSLVFVWSYANDTPEQRLEQANTAYQAQQYTAAIEQYESLVTDGYRSAELYYNLANSYYRQGQLGRAVLFYERTLLIAPRDTDAKYNLAVVRSQLQDKAVPLPPFFLAQWWNNFSLLMPSGAWSALSIVLLWLGVAGLIAWLLALTRRQKKLGFVLGVVMLSLSGLLLLVSAHRLALEKNSARAVVLEAEIMLYSAPDVQSQPIREIHEGITLQLLDKIGDWHKVALPTGEQGWLPDTAFEKI